MTHSQSLRLNPRAHMPLNYSQSLSSTNDNDPVSQIFDQFCVADTFRDIIDLFEQLCHAAGICPKDHSIFYQQLKKKLMSWRAQSLWFKLDKRASNREYKDGTACNKTRVLVIGAGPCGLRVAIEMALLGAKTVVVEKRDSFSRNNVLHLWPFLIHDLKALGAKKFFGKFCAGAIDHISIRTLQCILLKVALLMGVEIHSGVSFEGFLEPQNDAGDEDAGWRAKVIPGSHPVSEFIFDVCFSADGQRNTMTEFKRKELRGKFAIGITANFVNRKTQAEASVEEISGVSFIFNQKFFRDLYEETGIDLENIVYYKDETHYFVMTAKKQSLLKKGVLKQDYDDLEMLLLKENLNHESLLSYAREAASYSTNHQLPSLDFAPNYSGQPDVDMFDFTSMFSAENASRVIERRGHLLLIGLVGDTLLEPFWPTGSGCARGFLGALDGAWMVRSWASGEMSTLEVIAEREGIYQLLSQTKPDNLSKNYANYTIDPNTRYPNLQMHTYKPYQAKSLYDGKGNPNDVIHLSKRKNLLYGCSTRNWNLLRWFQKELESYEDLVAVVDFSKSWQSGLALCALIHRHWPHLVDVFSLDPKDVEYNNQLAFDILKEHCKLLPPTTGQYMAQANIPEEKMIGFLSQIQDHFRRKNLENRKAKAGFYDKKSSRSTGSLAEALIDPGSNAENIDKIEMIENNPSSLKPSQLNPESVIRTLKRIRENEAGQSTVSAKTVKSSELEDILNGSRHQKYTGISSLVWKPTKVSVLARDLVLKFKGEYVDDSDKKQSAKPVSPERQHLRDVCCSCRDRVFVTERCIAEGQLFHRQCFRCEYCCGLLDVSSYSAQKNDKDTDIFFHPRCHDIQMRKKENPIKQFNSHSSWVIAPVNRATFESTRRILIQQTKMKKNDRSRSQLQSNLVNQQTVVGTRGYDDDLKSSTEQELCFSDDSDSEKPDLSWDEYMRSAEKKAGLSRVMKGSLADKQQRTVKQMDDNRGSDADWETDTSDVDTDIPSSSDTSHDEGDRIARPSETVESRTVAAAATDQIQENKNVKPEQDSRLKNRMAFFGAVAEPVRINARQFLGLDPQIASDAASTAATNDTKNSEKEDAETEDKGFIQGDNMKEKGELREDKKAESDISKRQLKRKTKHKTKKKKLLRARKQTNEEKTNSRLSETAIASSVHAAKRQTVAVVPLSEESSGISDSSNEDEDSLEIKGYARLKTVPQHQSSVEDGNGRDYVALVSNASIDLQTSGPMEEEEEACLSAEMRDKESEEAMPFHVLDEDDFYSETNAPRPGLLVAEAMFRSYEESTVVTTTSGSDKCFDSSSSGNDDKAELLAPDKDDEDNRYGEDAPCQRSTFSNTEVEGKDSESFQHGSGSIDLRHEESSLNESAFVDLKSIPEVINDSCVTDLFEAQSDGISTMTADIGSQIHENVQAEEIHATMGPNLPYVECDVGRNLDTDYNFELSHDHSEKEHDASNHQSVLLKLENEDGGQIRKIHPTVDCLETRCPPRAESEESLSDDEREMSSDFLCQNTLPDKGDGIQQHRESLGKDKDYLLQSGLNVGKNIEFVGDEINTNCLDPVRRLDDLLCSLSSRSCCLSESNSPASLNTSFDDENVNSSRALCVQPKEQHLKKFHQEEGKIKCETVGDSVAADEHIANEESAVDENVNYIRPTLVSLQENGADKELGSSSSNSSRCLCMDVSEVVRNYETLGAEVSGCSPTATGYNEDVEKKREPRSTSGDVGYTDKNCSTVATVSLLDAKRRFFQEVAQPVRLNPLTVFRSDVPSKSPEEKPCHKIPLESGSSSKSKTPEEEKQLEIDSVTIREDKEINRQPLLTTPSSLDLSTKIEPHIQTDVVELGQLSNKLGTLSLSESEIDCKASVVAKRCSPSSVLLSPSNVLTKTGQTPLAAEKCASLPNVQLFTTVDESEKFMSHLLAENLRLDHKNLMKTWDRMKAGSSSMSEFRNSEIEMKIDEMHSTSSEIPDRLDESVELERQSTA